jgi:hypothetical protein
MTNQTIINQPKLYKTQYILTNLLTNIYSKYNQDNLITKKIHLRTTRPILICQTMSIPTSEAVSLTAILYFP